MLSLIENSFLKLFYVSVQIFLMNWEIRILQGFTFDFIHNPDKKIGNDLIKIWSGFSQYPFRILRGTIQEQVIQTCRKKNYKYDQDPNKKT